MAQQDDPDRWAHWRFAIIGPVLAAPPPHGQLRAELQTLADKTWTHPINATALRVSFATIERWFYRARGVNDPVAALRRCPREDGGCFRRLSAGVIQALQGQYNAHPGWTVQLHYDNLVALANEQTALQPLASYSTIRRFMKARGWQRQRPPKRQTPGAQQAAQRLQQWEVRSYEVEYVHGLWHADFHHGSRRVLTASGAWIYTGVYGPTTAEPLGHNHAANRQADSWVSLGWGFAWPANRRILYNRASADPAGNPWPKEQRLAGEHRGGDTRPRGYVYWDSAQQQWTGLDAPDFALTKSPLAEAVSK